MERVEARRPVHRCRVAAIVASAAPRLWPVIKSGRDGGPAATARIRASDHTPAAARNPECTRSPCVSGRHEAGVDRPVDHRRPEFVDLGAAERQHDPVVSVGDMALGRASSENHRTETAGRIRCVETPRGHRLPSNTKKRRVHQPPDVAEFEPVADATNGCCSTFSKNRYGNAVGGGASWPSAGGGLA